jgi:hypothetical protein
MSASSTRLATHTIVSLLSEAAAGAASVAAAPSAVDVMAALARLDARQHRGAVAVRATH